MERVFRISGDFGRFQLIVSSVSMLIALVSAFHILAPVYVLFDTPRFRCRLPEESGWHWNDTWAVQSDEHNASILSFIPEQQFKPATLSKCSIRVNNSEQACSDWVFDTEEFDNTLVTELGLFCKNSRWATFISTCSFAGILIGVVLAGYLADWLGRRISLIITLWVLTAALVASMFAVSVSYIAAVRFMIGLGALSSYTVSYVILFEVVGPKARHHVVAAFGYSWSLGTAIVALSAYLSRSWRNYAAMSLAPTAVLLVLAHFPCLVPETPRWLMSRGRHRDAADIVRRMLAQNGKSEEEAELAIKEMQELRSCEHEQEGESAENGTSVRKSFLLLVRSPRLLLRYGIMCCNWFVVAAVYYGISLGAKNLPGNIFVTSCLIGSIDFPSYMIMHLAANRLGRKATYVASLGGSGLALIGLATTSYLAKDLEWLIITFSLIGKMLNSTAFSLLYIWTGELYPTNMRSAGVSTSSMFARFGTLFAPLLGNIRDFVPGDFGPLLSYIVFAVSSFTGAGMAMAVPETRGLAIADTVEDLVKTDSGDFPSGESKSVDVDLSLKKAVEVFGSRDALGVKSRGVDGGELF